MTREIKFRAWTGKAIEKSIEGGYDHDQKFLEDIYFTGNDKSMFLDPEFWKCLGKSMGWKKEKIINTPRLGTNIKVKAEWTKQAIRFFTETMEGKSPEDYFKNL